MSFGKKCTAKQFNSAVLPSLAQLDPPAGLAVTIAGWGDTIQVNGTGSNVSIGATCPSLLTTFATLPMEEMKTSLLSPPLSMMCTGDVHPNPIS
ncbi:hypothetical protein OUZ56_002434 [Daphnia magna]|uniref:Peptidase S1 domain-containing protein n=1 Tax=Daphnia magna TaxID=35525 RepID=A0ABR0A5P1_9CRUS|nr:hypothetical protein OUZ56_002434 [Daphnia magna]